MTVIQSKKLFKNLFHTKTDTAEIFLFVRNRKTSFLTAT